MRRNILLFIILILFSGLTVVHADEDDGLRSVIEKWRIAWEREQFETYIDFYSRDFKTGKFDFDAWRNKKALVFKNSRRLNIKLRNILVSIKGDAATAEFLQLYESSSLKSIGQKEVIFKRENGKWKIYSEFFRPVDRPSIYSALMSDDENGGKNDVDVKDSKDKDEIIQDIKRKKNSIPEEKKYIPDNINPVADNKNKVSSSADEKKRNKEVAEGKINADNIEVRHINFELEENKESVFIDLGAYAQPKIYSIDGVKPRVIIDIKKVKKWEGHTKIPVNGKFIKQIRIYLNRNSETLRAILDLEPEVGFTPRTGYYHAENIFSMEFEKKTIQ